MFGNAPPRKAAHRGIDCQRVTAALARVRTRRTPIGQGRLWTSPRYAVDRTSTRCGASSRREDAMGLIDLSHPIEDGMAAYPGSRPRVSSRSSITTRRATGMRDRRSSSSVAPSWPATREPISMPRSIAFATAMISRPCRWRASLVSQASLLTRAEPSGRFRSMGSRKGPFADARSWCERAGMPDGGRRSTGRMRRSCPRRWWSN